MHPIAKDRPLEDATVLVVGADSPRAWGTCVALARAGVCLRLLGTEQQRLEALDAQLVQPDVHLFHAAASPAELARWLERGGALPTRCVLFMEWAESSEQECAEVLDLLTAEPGELTEQLPRVCTHAVLVGAREPETSDERARAEWSKTVERLQQLYPQLRVNGVWADGLLPIAVEERWFAHHSTKGADAEPPLSAAHQALWDALMEDPEAAPLTSLQIGRVVLTLLGPEGVYIRGQRLTLSGAPR